MNRTYIVSCYYYHDQTEEHIAPPTATTKWKIIQDKIHVRWTTFRLVQNIIYTSNISTFYEQNHQDKLGVVNSDKAGGHDICTWPCLSVQSAQCNSLHHKTFWIVTKMKLLKHPHDHIAKAKQKTDMDNYLYCYSSRKSGVSTIECFCNIHLKNNNNVQTTTTTTTTTTKIYTRENVKNIHKMKKWYYK